MRTDAYGFLDCTKTAPGTELGKSSGSILYILKCEKEKASKVANIEHHICLYFVSEGRRNPQNTISSQMRIKNETTNA